MGSKIGLGSIMNFPNLDSYLDPDRHDPALQGEDADETFPCDQCERPITDAECYPMRGGALCDECYYASVERTPVDDDAELDGQNEGAE